jgi:hypothetical protein
MRFDDLLPDIPGVEHFSNDVKELLASLNSLTTESLLEILKIDERNPACTPTDRNLGRIVVAVILSQRRAVDRSVVERIEESLECDATGRAILKIDLSQRRK